MLTHHQSSNLVKFLAISAVQAAKSGHPGAPLGCADIMTVLWQKYLQLNPHDPTWINRDRFILSNGHASAMLYALLYLRGFNLKLDDLQQFRQLHSLTPGHPELDQQYGIEATTGPLGQGFANAVGIALAAKLQAQSLDTEGQTLLDYRSYVLVGDGCLMEGISHEAANLASVWELEKLIVMWDNNNITIDGYVTMVSKEDTSARFTAYGWDVIGPVDGHDPIAIQNALQLAQLCNGKPKFINFITTIGCGVQDGAGTSAMHGSPLSTAQWQQLTIDLAVSESMVRDHKLIQQWQQHCPNQYDSWQQRWNNSPAYSVTAINKLNSSLTIPIPPVLAMCSTRVASQQWIQAACMLNSTLIGGSADLDASTLTYPGATSIAPYIHYGVREFAMCAIANGLTLAGYRPFVSTFLVFSDYAKNAIRMAALMKLGVIYIFTHDSIGLGEDGPTHQPVEQLLALRSIPGLETWRPADAAETFIAWREAMLCEHGPTALVLSRQNLPIITNTNIDLTYGAHIVLSHNNPELIICATGSEVTLAIQASLQLPHRAIQILSCPNLNRFRNSVLHHSLAKIAPFFIIEAASGWSWGDIQPNPDFRLTLDNFGMSAPGPEVQRACGFSIENVLLRLKNIGYD